ncbi:hypothetical protein D3C72_2403830 [compost metagenome]
MAIHGSGIAHTATFSNQRWRSSARRADSTKKVPVSRISSMPMPTITRNSQNSGATCGTVSHAALAICSSVAWRGSST